MRTHHHPARTQSTRTSRPSSRDRGDLSNIDVRIRFNSASDIIFEGELDLLNSIMPDLIKAMIDLEMDYACSGQSTCCGTNQQSGHVVYEAKEN